VQETIEERLEQMHRSAVVLMGAGRTDTGVHAYAQVANFYTTIERMNPEQFVPALNKLLPQDVRILKAFLVPPSFHARFNAVSRTYRYYIVCGRAALPHELRYAHQLWRIPQLERLNSYARALRGERDCSIFAASTDKSRSKNRFISQAFFYMDNGFLIFEITANAFLQKMVRSIVGTLLFYEEKGYSVPAFEHVLQSGDRSQAGPTIAPNGLFLCHVTYG
jgi:tRNA pseudouridine38-40 synthase